jgi:hypothetical protein
LSALPLRCMSAFALPERGFRPHRRRPERHLTDIAALRY